MWPEDKESARKRLRHRHTLSALVFLDVFFFKTYKKRKEKKKHLSGRGNHCNLFDKLFL